MFRTQILEGQLLHWKKINDKFEWYQKLVILLSRRLDLSKLNLVIFCHKNRALDANPDPDSAKSLDPIPDQINVNLQHCFTTVHRTVLVVPESPLSYGLVLQIIYKLMHS